jgi:hypothetical protein
MVPPIRISNVHLPLPPPPESGLDGLLLLADGGHAAENRALIKAA